MNTMEMNQTTVTMKGEFIPTFGTVIDGIGTVNTALVRVRTTDLKFLPTKANPRSYNEGGTTTKKIAETLSNEPELFEVLNRGLTVVSSDCTYKAGNVIFTFTDDSQGLVDGGHSFYTAMKNQSSNAKVIIKVIYNNGAEELANRISETFNTSEKVKEMSLNNLRGYFEFIKKELKNKEYFCDIKWEQNAKKRISCSRIIGLMNCFNPVKYGHGIFGEKTTGNPSDSYNSEIHTQNDFKKCFEEYGETINNPYFKMKYVIPELIELFEWAECNFVRLYNKNKGCSYNKVTATLPNKTKVKLFEMDGGNHTTMFYNKELGQYIPMPFIYPIIAPLRIFLEEDKDGFYYFIVDPKEILEEVGPYLIKYVLSNYLDNYCTTVIMKEPTFWSTLYEKTIIFKNTAMRS
jgi:hypothetical protein